MSEAGAGSGTGAWRGWSEVVLVRVGMAVVVVVVQPGVEPAKQRLVGRTVVETPCLCVSLFKFQGTV